MAKFKKGDIVVLKKDSEYYIPKAPKYSSNPIHTEGVITSVSSGEFGIQVKWNNNTTNGYSFKDLELFNQKTEKMATRKTTTKQFQLEAGQYFTATYDKKKVRGVVANAPDDYDNFVLYGKDFDDDAEDDDAEFSTQLYIDMYGREDQSHTDVLKDYGITNFVLLTDKRQKAIVDGDKCLTVAGHKVHIKGNFVNFGCGAVSTTKKEIKDFYAVYKDVDVNEHMRYKELIDEIGETAFEEAVAFYNQFKMYTTAQQKAFNNLVREMDNADNVFLEDLNRKEVDELMKKLD